MTLTMSVEMPDSFSLELRSLLTGLLQRDVHKRLGCRGRGADEIKSHPFFRGIDWRVVFLQRLPPPLIPARGEVNAADAFDIGSFDDEDTKHIKLSEADQELYRNFPVVVSERWQHEIAETIFDYINHEADKAEMKRKNKHKLGYQEEEQSDCILHGYIKRLGGTFTATWLTRYVRLYPNRLELWSDSGKQPELIFMDQMEEVCNDYVQIKNEQCIVIKLYNHSKYVFTNSDEIGLKEWHVSLKAAHKESLDMMTTMAEKATKIYGTEIPLKHMGKRRQQLQLEASSISSSSGSGAGAGSNNNISSTGSGGAGSGNGSNSAIANLEQKIIQKELQASSSKTPELAHPVGKPAPLRGLENVCHRQAMAGAQVVAPPGVVGGHSHATPGATHKHQHRGHHQHRSHHHRHHHHAGSAKHSVGGPPGWSASSAQAGAAAGPHRHQHRHVASRHLAHRQPLAPPGGQHPMVLDQAHHPGEPNCDASPVAAASADHPQAIQQPGLASGQQAIGSGEQQQQQQQQQHKQEPDSISKETISATERQATDSAVFTGEPSSSASGEQQQTSKRAVVAEPEPEVGKQELPTSGDNDRVSQLGGGTSATERADVAIQQSDSIDSSSSGQSGSCSSSGDADESKEKGAKVSLQVTAASLDQQDPSLADDPDGGQAKSLAPEVVESETSSSSASCSNSESASKAEAMSTKQRNKDQDQEQQHQQQQLNRPRLALSLENVSEHQEVLRDPSKRITSDNKQREQDLVAQYEKLNIGSRNSSSSIEEEPLLIAPPGGN